MSRHLFPRAMLVASGVCGLLLVGAVSALAQQSDPSNDAAQAYAATPPSADSEQEPGRVARLAYLSGQVQFAPAGENDWGSVDINRPMVIGDRLLTGDDGLAALELGDASVRIDHDSAFDFLNLDQDNVQIELSQGTLNLAVRELADGESFEVDTPTVAFVASTPGVYRIDDDPDGNGSMVTVLHGSGIVYGENGASRQVVEGSSYRFNDSALASVAVDALPQPDGFDRFCETRDANYARYTQQEQQYVPSDMIGGDDLYQYGQWDSVPEYGNVWYPTSVPLGWAPYSYGHWAWIGQWGWTWVDNQPWGFAPFHYGRWVHVRSRWGWVPGPLRVRPVYAPALVAFIGGSGLSMSLRIGGGPVGWFPLGPRDIYVPWFHASRRYFTRVNVTNIRNVYVNKTAINNIYNDYHHQRFSLIHQYNRYANRSMPGAVTAVPRDVFTGARPVHPAALRLDPDQLAHTKPAFVPDVLPGTASLGLRRVSRRPAVLHGRVPFARPVVARHTPPPQPVEFAKRAQAIAGQHGQPLTTVQMRNLGKQRFSIEPRDARVKLVPALAGAPTGAATLRGMRHGAPPPRPVEPSASVAMQAGVRQRHAEPVTRRDTPAQRPSIKDTVHPVPARDPRARPAPRPLELPSARFAHSGQSGRLPRVPVIHPDNGSGPKVTASERLPVVRPLESAPRSFDAGVPQQQRQAGFAAQQQARVQRRQQQMQEQTQGIPAQQAERQQAPRTQSPQRFGEQQALQQRETQAVQRTREPPQQTWQQSRPVRMQQVQRETRPSVLPREHYVPHSNNGGAHAHRTSSQSGKHPKGPKDSGGHP